MVKEKVIYKLTSGSMDPCISTPSKGKIYSWGDLFRWFKKRSDKRKEGNK